MFPPTMEKLLNNGQLFSFKSKHKIIKEFVHTLGIIGKLLMGFSESDLVPFRPKVLEILNLK
jgi:hypothetical protein